MGTDHINQDTRGVDDPIQRLSTGYPLLLWENNKAMIEDLDMLFL